MDVNVKSLVGKLNSASRKALEAAAGLCVSRTNYEVEIEHWLLKLAELPNTDFQRVLRHFEIDRVRLSSDLNRVIDQLKTGNTRTPALSPYIVRLLNGAWLFASIDFDSSRIRSSHLLLAFLADGEMVHIRNSSTQWEKITAESLHSNLIGIVKDSDEEKDEAQAQEPELETENVPANSRIFISYRREDSGGWAGRLYDRLGQHFHRNNIFMDVDTIELGLEFPDVIQNSVATCNVLIALIGRRWLESIDDAGQRRLDNPEDYVRLEITAALERKIRVIPVLLQGSTMPASKDLPDPLKPLTRRNALQMDEARFDHDVTKLIDVLDRTLKAKREAQ